MDKVVKIYVNLCNCEELYNRYDGVSNVTFYRQESFTNSDKGDDFRRQLAARR